MDQDNKDIKPLQITVSLEPPSFVPAHCDLLVSLPLLTGLPYQILEPFLLNCEYKQLQCQERLLSPGQNNAYLYVLLSGQLSAHIKENEADKGFRILPGEFVGEVSIVDNQPPTSFVSAVQSSLLLCIHETVLWAEFMRIPGAARNMLQQISKRSRARNLSIEKSLEKTLRLELLDKELRIAQDLQISMLPQPPFFSLHSGVEVNAMMKAAKEVGGDLYDAFPLDDERVCVAIGDVAGKGIPAALFMVRTITVLRTEMMKTKDLQKTISSMNVILSQDNPQCMFVTLMICVLNLSNGELQYVNGGHNRPLLGQVGQGFKYLEQPKGILVGINPLAIYQVATRFMIPGEILILYTDGVTEANNQAQEEYTEQRLLEFINQNEEQAVGGIVSNIEKSVQKFVAGAEQSDDLTLLVLRYLTN
jgi:sigma-B regulation protein RsbU (phosphoserine phosphatase)